MNKCRVSLDELQFDLSQSRSEQYASEDLHEKKLAEKCQVICEYVMAGNDFQITQGRSTYYFSDGGITNQFVDDNCAPHSDFDLVDKWGPAIEAARNKNKNELLNLIRHMMEQSIVGLISSLLEDTINEAYEIVKLKWII